MRPHLCWVLPLALGGLLRAAEPGAEAPQGVTYVIPIRNEIERALVYVIRRGAAQAEQEGAGAIIFDMDTPGGRLDATEEIINTIIDARATTYTFVNRNAISAGAIIAMATDHIYMAPGGRIGDAMPVMMSPLPMGGVQEIPDGLREKAMSPTVALMRSAAQRKGHDVQLAESMVRPELGYKIGEDVICAPGQILTLTNQDAERQVGEGDSRRPLLSEGTVKDLPELLARINRTNTRVVTLEITGAERLARFIEGFAVSGLLLAVGLLLLYIEFKTPGFGLPGISGIVLLAIWFWGHQIAGLAGMGEILLFIAGVVLLLVEIFLIPGFGVVGLSGLALIMSAFLMAMVQHYPGAPWYRLPRVQVQGAVEVLGFSLALVFVLGAVVARFLPKIPIFCKLALQTAETRDLGYLPSVDKEHLVGLEGVAATALRPAGFGRFGDRRLDVVSRGDFIEQGAAIVIAETTANRIVVERGARAG